MKGAIGLGMHAPLGGGLGYFLVNGGHILQAMHIWLDTTFAFFTSHKESSKALEVVVMVDLHV